MPFRLAVVGKSFLSGKTTFICNLLLREKFYRKKFLGEEDPKYFDEDGNVIYGGVA